MKLLPAVQLSQPRPPHATPGLLCHFPFEALLLAPCREAQDLAHYPAASAVGPKMAVAAQLAAQRRPMPWTVEALHCASPESTDAQAYEYSYIAMQFTACSFKMSRA